MAKKADNRVIAYITNEQKNFLQLVIAESNTIKSTSGAVQWCIDACQAIEKTYEEDALHVGLNDVREELKAWKESQINVWAPVLNFAYENGEKLGIKTGDSISAKVLEILKQKLR